jgi:hypothetical protein
MDGNTVFVPVVPDIVKAVDTNSINPNMEQYNNVVAVKPIKITKRKRIAIAADKVVSFALGNTVGRVAKIAGKRLLGEIPQEAIQGSYAPTAADLTSSSSSSSSDQSHQVLFKQQQQQNGISSMNEQDQKELLDEVAQQLGTPVIDSEDEALFQKIYNDERSGSSTAVPIVTPAIKEQSMTTTISA